MRFVPKILAGSEGMSAMSRIFVPTAHRLQGKISVPGDKSITHRAIILSSIAAGKSSITTTILGRDNMRSLAIMQQLGVNIDGEFNAPAFVLAEEEGIQRIRRSTTELCTLHVSGVGLNGLSAPTKPLYCGNSGTTARLFMGLLAGCSFSSEFNGDASLLKRPFLRIIEPLREMGANFSGEKLPLTVSGGKLHGLQFLSPVPSAQVKSALLLAGLHTMDQVSITEPTKSRDHSERMLQAMGVELQEISLANGCHQVILPRATQPHTQRQLKAQRFIIPGDFSSAAFFIVAASLVPNSDIVIQRVGFNPTRLGLYSLLLRMGARIEVLDQNEVCGEPVANLRVRSAPLRGIDVGEKEVVLAIDEIPILSAAAALAEGVTVIRGAKELRVKESDRLRSICDMLNAFSLRVKEQPDGLIIHGCGRERQGLVEKPILSRPWEKSLDHRMIMSAAVLEFSLKERLEIGDIAAVETSFPSFLECFQQLTERSAQLK